MKYLQSKRLKLIFILIITYVSLIYTACSTKPDFAEKNYPGILAIDGRVLLYFNLEKDSFLLSHFLSAYSSEDLSGILDRTDRLSISIDGYGTSSNFDIIAEGKFPRFFSNIALGREENWIKHKETHTYWENTSNGLYVSIPLSSVAIISNNEIIQNLEYMETGQRRYIPDIIKSEFEQSMLTVYSHLPGAGIYSSLKIPHGKMLIQDLFFVIKKESDRYKISGELDFLDEKDAKLFSTALKMGLLMKLRETGKSSIMTIVHDGRIDAVNNRIIVDNILLDSDDMIDLLSGTGAGIQGN